MTTTWRLLVKSNAAAGGPTVAEFALAATAGGPSLFTGGTPAASSANTSGSYGVANAFDGNLGTTWSAAQYAPGWVQYTPSTEISPVELRITSLPDSTTNGAPLTFDLQNDKATPGTFVTVQSYTAGPWSGASQVQTFAVPVAAAGPAPGLSNAIVSQSRLEVLGKGLPKVTVAQSQLEVLGKTNPAALVSQSFVEVLFRPASNTAGSRPRRVFVAMT